MTPPSRITGRDWLAALLAGAVLGAGFLGAGARLGMRVIALANGQSPLFTFGGTVTVTLLGAACGGVAAVIFMLGRIWFPRRRWLRVLLFTALVTFLVVRGLHPVSPLNLAIFGPLFIAHGALLHAYWCRVHLRRRLASG
jgi:hypothetical protein